MKITQENKEEIQWFVYFLFKGTLTTDLIFNKSNYIEELIKNPTSLDRCFEIFANEKSFGKDYETATKKVAEFIITKNYDAPIKLNSFWSEFLIIASIFSHEKFELPIKSFHIKYLDGCGSDAVPFFAVWTNVIEIDIIGNCINKGEALRRSNERLLFWDSKEVSKPFTEKELEQEIY